MVIFMSITTEDKRTEKFNLELQHLTSPRYLFDDAEEIFLNELMRLVLNNFLYVEDTNHVCVCSHSQNSVAHHHHRIAHNYDREKAS